MGLSAGQGDWIAGPISWQPPKFKWPHMVGGWAHGAMVRAKRLPFIPTVSASLINRWEAISCLVHCSLLPRSCRSHRAAAAGARASHPRASHVHSQMELRHLAAAAVLLLAAQCVAGRAVPQVHSPKVSGKPYQNEKPLIGELSCDQKQPICSPVKHG